MTAVRSQKESWTVFQGSFCINGGFMSTLEYASTDKQIEKLKKRNLIIRNENSAQRVLTVYGYSNVIKSYRDPYVITRIIKNFFDQMLLLSKYFRCIPWIKIYELPLWHLC